MKLNTKHLCYITIIGIAGMSLTGLFLGCAATPQQAIAAGVEGAGQACGAYLLAKNPSPEYLVTYKILVPKMAHVMQGAMSPADYHLLNTQFQQNVKLTPSQQSALAFLSSINGSFVRNNGGAAPTIDGAKADAAAKTFALGLSEAVGFVTGNNWTMPSEVPSTSP